MLSVKKAWMDTMGNRKIAVIFFAGILFSQIIAGVAFAFQCADVTEIPATECAALQDLFNGTNGANWKDNTGWLANNTPCGWFGIVCKNGELAEIHLAGNGLQGQLPESIGNLSGLEYLNVNDNEVTGTVPSSIGQLTELQGLWVGGNQITAIPDSIGDCAKLTHLELKKNQISNIPFQIGKLTGLTYLTLWSNKLTDAAIPAELANLISLTSLSFHDNQLTKLPAPVAALTNLTLLDLSWNKPMNSLAGIGQLTGLESLRLNSTELTEVPEEIANLTNLKELLLSENFLTQFPALVTQLTALETLRFTYNPQMVGELPLSLVNLTKMKEFKIDGTGVCVPQDTGLQAWLAGIATVVSSGKECAANFSTSELEKAVRIMRMLTGHEGSCSDLDASGDGKVGSGDAVLALKKAANLTAYQDNWTTIGTVPEFSFSSEPLIDENTAFTMNVDPSDQLMLTAVTTNGWTVEYFAVKDQMGAPVVLTGIHANKDDTNEYLEMKFDGEGHPISIEQQGNKKVILNWENYTIYGEKEWTVVGELPDVSSIQSPVVDDQSEVVTNTDPSDPLWLTLTTTNGWVIKYFAKKDIYGAAKALVFISAEEIIGNNIIKTIMDDYGFPAKFSVNEGTIIALDWILHEVHIENGFLQAPIEAIHSAISDIDACTAASILANTSCNFLGFLEGRLKAVGVLATGHICGVATMSLGTAFCPSASPELLECNIKTSLIGHAGGIAVGLVGLLAATGVGAPLAVAIGAGYSLATGIGAYMTCNNKYGSNSGDPHLRTFDGLGYDFQAVGEFLYLQSTQDPTEMTIQIRLGPWPGSKRIATNKALVTSVGGDIVEINVENTPRLSINNTPVTMADKEIIQLKNGCKIYAETQSKYWIIWKDNSMAEVRMHSRYLDVFVSLPDNRKGLIKGLLGNSDGDKTNDLQTRDGSKTFDIANKLTKGELYNEFGNSWRITQAESLFTYATGKNTATYTDLNFPYELVRTSDLSETVRANAEQICRNAGITNPILLEDCILDVGMTGDSTFADNMTDLTPPEQSITVTDDWLLYGDAQQAEGEKTVHITTDETSKTGMALREGALNLDADFEKTFAIYMGDDDSGGDGMVFLMLSEMPSASILLNSSNDDELGFSSACNGNPCLGVEIDSYYPVYDHIALIKNGSNAHGSTENQTLPFVPLTFNIEDGTTHSLTISWKKEAQLLSVALDGDTLIMHEGLDLKTLLGTSVATYGFVGATGSATNEQYFYPVVSF